MIDLSSKIRVALRGLRRAPAFSVAVVLSLALGIGANSTMFTILDAVLLRPLPYPHPDELVSASVGSGGAVADSYFLAWAAATRTLSSIAEYNPLTMVVGGATGPQEVPGAIASPSLSGVIGVTPALGRFIAAEDGVAGAPPVVVLGDELWRRNFNGDPHILGRELRINDVPTTVVGVMPAAFAFPPRAVLWLPRPPIDNRPTAGVRAGLAVGRRRAGVSLSDVQRELAQVPRTADMERSLNFRGAPVVVVSLHDNLYGSARTALALLFAAVTLLLLVACANVANLVLARSTRRRQEFAIRAALGASRATLYWEVVTECLLLAVAAGVLGVLLSVWLSQLFTDLSPNKFSNVDRIGLDGRVLLFTVGVSVLTAFLIGSAAAVVVSASGARAIVGENVSRTGTGKLAHLIRRSLVVVQLSAAIVLLTGAGLLAKSLGRLAAQDNGFQPRNLLILTVNLASSRYRGPGAGARASEFFDRLATRLAAMPDAQRVAQGPPPLVGFVHMYLQPATGESPSFRVAVSDVGPGYFETYRVPVTSGRSLTALDDSTHPPVVVVNATAARLIAPGGNAIGRSLDVISIHGQHPTIVGIVADVPQNDIAVHPLAEAFSASKQDPHWPMWIAVRVKGDPDALSIPAQLAVKELDPAVIVRTSSMESMIASSLAPRRFTAVLLGSFAALALSLAAVGLFGVISYLVEQRTREIGVRIALGAQRGHVLVLVLGEGLMLIAAGLPIGVGLAIALSRFLRSLLYEVQPSDIGVITAAALMLSIIAIVAAYIPARHAMRIDPLVALRAE